MYWAIAEHAFLLIVETADDIRVLSKWNWTVNTHL